MNQMQPDIYEVAPMAPASDSVPVIMPVGHQINIQCYNKTVCLLETGDTRFPASTNSSSYIMCFSCIIAIRHSQDKHLKSVFYHK